MDKQLLTILLLLCSLLLAGGARNSYQTRGSSFSSLKCRVQWLERTVGLLQGPVHLHMHGDNEGQTALSDLSGLHVHVHLDINKAQTVAEEWTYASCYVQPNQAYTGTTGNNVRGHVHFRQKPSGKLEMKLDLSGLPGQGFHGFHVHERTDYQQGCNSFGGHFNPLNQVHGGPQDEIRHVGDFGNVEADAQGRVRVTLTDNMASLFGPNTILGRGIVIHAGEDDLGRGGNPESLKTGNAGARLACCIIGSSKDGHW